MERELSVFSYKDITVAIINIVKVEREVMAICKLAAVAM